MISTFQMWIKKTSMIWRKRCGCWFETAARNRKKQFSESEPKILKYSSYLHPNWSHLDLNLKFAGTPIPVTSSFLPKSGWCSESLVSCSLTSTTPSALPQGLGWLLCSQKQAEGNFETRAKELLVTHIMIPIYN